MVLDADKCWVRCFLRFDFTVVDPQRGFTSTSSEHGLPVELESVDIRDLGFDGVFSVLRELIICTRKKKTESGSCYSQFSTSSRRSGDTHNDA